MKNGVVIVGTGQGGFQLAASLRQEGFQDAITMIGDEPGLPYQRPPLSKTYLKEGRVEAIQLRPESYYERNGIRLISPERAIRIDRAAKTVETLTGGSIGYDHLVLATGARNVIPPIPGLEACNVHQLRTAADADNLRSALVSTRNAIVIGGGFIGLEFAAVAASSGHRVTVVEAAPRLMSRAISPDMSEAFRIFHGELGTNLYLGCSVAEVLRGDTGRAHGVRLSDGRTIEGDLILLAAGIRPNTELAEVAGLAVSNGIVVDAGLVSQDPDISSLGDCAAFHDLERNCQLRLESVQAATDHARTIARRLTGKAAQYDALPWFWSDQANWKLQIAGLGHDADDDVAITRPDGRKLVFRFKVGKLLAVETVNAAGEHMAARQLLRYPGGVTAEALAARDFDISGLAKALKELS
ncbi:NAD(P)/FAD-dependent oxidoreductase [Rhizobium puerariae]|uniref:NAD(P)/FAD-dependent oxidoreductase n=1 Tax=Rhizobium puerariae TaxID=1585791 RepID=A0ABV6AAD7_9HYPH